MENSDKISVIIPVYNLENYIVRTLDSVCSQTYQNLEIIAVDDGSTDNSWEIIKKYSKNDSRIICIRQENSGVTCARLNGLSNATGSWIGFVDGDDEIEADMYEFLLSNARKYSSDISHCGYKMLFEDGRINYFHNTSQILEQDNYNGLIDLLNGTIVEPGLCNKLFKKELFIRANIKEKMDFSIKNTEDLLMNFYLFCESEKSVFIDECKYKYIVRNNSASRRKKNEHTVFDPIKVKEQILKNSPKGIETIAQKSYIGTCISIYNGLIVSDNGKQFINPVRQIIINNKAYIKLSSKKIKLLGNLIVYFPILYKFIYKLYEKYFQVKKYS